MMELLAALLNLAGWILSLALRRPWPWIRLDVQEAISPFFARANRVYAPPRSFDAIIRIHNRGPGDFTVDSAGWTAADGESYEANLPPDRTLKPGGPELHASAGAGPLLQFTRDHRGLMSVYVKLAGRDKPHQSQINDEWRARLREQGGE